mmetsp:Transcript_29396/g.80145  ORF Transcript_29396/g.80145 Transcript_29396/m.80145 type:complete len:215 (-) Transcript_29396:1179-1823(-)|eukprot:scaffold301100_cov27-Tisochrysis_lutea.AAC.1
MTKPAPPPAGVALQLHCWSPWWMPPSSARHPHRHSPGRSRQSRGLARGVGASVASPPTHPHPLTTAGRLLPSPHHRCQLPSLHPAQKAVIQRRPQRSHMHARLSLPSVPLPHPRQAYAQAPPYPGQAPALAPRYAVARDLADLIPNRAPQLQGGPMAATLARAPPPRRSLLPLWMTGRLCFATRAQPDCRLQRGFDRAGHFPRPEAVPRYGEHG